MKYFKRESYLQKIRGFYNDTEIIKVITGVRRCGKSSLMQTIAQELRDKGVSEENIIYFDYSSTAGWFGDTLYGYGGERI